MRGRRHPVVARRLRRPPLPPSGAAARVRRLQRPPAAASPSALRGRRGPPRRLRLCSAPRSLRLGGLGPPTDVGRVHRWRRRWPRRRRRPPVQPSPHGRRHSSSGTRLRAGHPWSVMTDVSGPMAAQPGHGLHRSGLACATSATITRQNGVRESTSNPERKENQTIAPIYIVSYKNKGVRADGRARLRRAARGPSSSPYRSMKVCNQHLLPPHPPLKVPWPPRGRPPQPPRRAPPWSPPPLPPPSGRWCSPPLPDSTTWPWTHRR